MNIVQYSVSVILFISLVCVLTLIVYIIRQQRLFATRYFFLLLLSSLIYIFGYLCAINSTTAGQARFWSYVQYLAIPLQPYLWLMMTLEYVEADRRSQRFAGIVGLYHPVMFMLIFYTNPIHCQYISSEGFISNGYFMIRVTQKGILFQVMMLSGTLICLICLIIYIYSFLASAKEHRIGIVTMALALLPPWLAVYFSASPFNTLKLDYLPVASALSALLYVVSVFRFRMFRFIPIAYEKVFRKSSEGILLADATGRIIDANEAITVLYPELSHRSKFLVLSEFCNNHPELKSLLQEHDNALYEWPQNASTGHYQAQITEIKSADERQMGWILSISDVTLLMERQRHWEEAASAALNEAEVNELSFLQSQIEPHFLNNTLSVIASMITRCPEEAKELIADLGEHLRNCYYFDSSSPMVSLEKELESVNTYVTIEKARFRERLNYHLIETTLPKIMIPKLILQPLVENAIRHGILKKPGEGNVWVRIREEEGNVWFEVRDDGVGMEEEMIEKILCDTDQIPGIGLSNIHRRLRRYYGEGLQMISRQGEGTRIIFRIPYNTVLEEESTNDKSDRAG